MIGEGRPPSGSADDILLVREPTPKAIQHEICMKVLQWQLTTSFFLLSTSVTHKHNNSKDHHH